MGVRLFGLTGGIASGKSSVAARLRARGVPVIDADELAREVVLPGTDGLREVVRSFGTKVLLRDGSLDRKALGALVFANADERKQLNAILHPRIAALTMQRAAELEARGEPLGCYEAALIVENAMADAFRPLVVVAAPIDVQAERAALRDAISPAEARARIEAQVPLADKIAVADFVIENTGTLEELARKTDEVLVAVCSRVGVDPARYPLR